jgi:hypothetical protein
MDGGSIFANHNIVITIGPEVFTYLGLVKLLKSILHVEHPIISVPPAIGFLAGWLFGRINEKCDHPLLSKTA